MAGGREDKMAASSRFSQGGADVLALTFATTVATWSMLYVAAMPPGRSSLWLAVAVLIVACLLGAGYVLGRFGRRGPLAGAGLGASLAGVNLLILLSLLGGTGDSAAVTSAGLWIAGYLGVAVALGAAGAAVGRRGAPPEADVNWTGLLAWVTAITMMLMIIAGGIVTGLEAGLAVEGWIVAEGHFLVLFPITLMQRNVETFAEHAHRLWGLLVGLTTIVLAVHLWLVDRRKWPRWLAAAIVLAVIVQGTLGGTRVTEQSVALGIVHGVFAQVVLAALVVLTMGCTTMWRNAPQDPGLTGAGGTDRTLGLVLLLVILVQITLGTLFRHLQPQADVKHGVLIGLLHGHSFVGSLLVLITALFCGVRAWGLYPDQPGITRAGRALVSALLLQVALGIGAFIVVPKGARDPETVITVAEVALTTAHQATGALLLATAAALAAWERRGSGFGVRGSGSEQGNPGELHVS